MTPTNHTGRYEALAELYCRRTGSMAPGKSAPMESGEDTSREENRARWEDWLVSRAWNDVLDELVRLRSKHEKLLEEHEELRDSLGEDTSRSDASG